MRRLLLVVLAASVGCATGSSGSGDDGDDTPVELDAPPGGDFDGPPVEPPPDAEEPPPDADTSPVAVTLSQSGATSIESPNTVVCQQGDPPTHSLENSVYRAFRLADHGVSGQYTATRVDLGIEQAETVAGSQTIQVILHTVAGTFPAGALTQLHSQNVTVSDVTGLLMPITLSAPVVVPAGSTLVVEVRSAGFTVANNFFFPGSNTATETAPSYIKSTACSINSPVTFASIGFPEVRLVLQVVGTTP